MSSMSTVPVLGSKNTDRKRRRSERDIDQPNMGDDFRPISKRIVSLSIRKKENKLMEGLQTDEIMSDDEDPLTGYAASVECQRLSTQYASHVPVSTSANNVVPNVCAEMQNELNISKDVQASSHESQVVEHGRNGYPNYPYEPCLHHPLYYEQNQRLYYLYLERQQRNGQILHQSFYDQPAASPQDQHRA